MRRGCLGPLSPGTERVLAGDGMEWMKLEGFYHRGERQGERQGPGVRGQGLGIRRGAGIRGIGGEGAHKGYRGVAGRRHSGIGGTRWAGQPWPIDTYSRRGTFLREGDSGEGAVGAIIGAARMAWAG